METVNFNTINVDCTTDMIPTSLISNTPTGSHKKKRPNTPVSISLRHDHCYEKSPRSLKRQLASACKLIRNTQKRMQVKLATDQATDGKNKLLEGYSTHIAKKYICK